MKGRRAAKTAAPALSIFALCTAALPPLAVAPAKGPGAPAVADAAAEGRAALLAEAVRGKLTPKLIDLYYHYAEQRARSSTPAEKVGAELWKWLDARSDIRHAVLAGGDVEYAGYAVARLAQLRSEFGGEVDRCWPLAVAFALVYGRGGEEPLWRLDWVAKGRPRPTMAASFRYYVDHRDQMLFPPDSTPWPLLLHVADNTVPIAERQWALARYKGQPLKSLLRLHSDPSYIKGAHARKMAGQEGAPMALPRILRDGGVCSQKAYYAISVLKSLGVPAFRLLGEGHAWEGVVLPGKPYTMVFPTKLGRLSGTMRCPLTRAPARQHVVQMRVAAVSKSVPDYLAARIAAATYSLVPSDRKRRATGLLWEAIERNGYGSEAWRQLARAGADGLLSEAEVAKVYPAALRVLADYPAMTCEIFLMQISSKLVPMSQLSDRQLAEITRTFEEEAGRYDKLKRVDLDLQLRKALGTYVGTLRGPEAVCDLYDRWLTNSKRHTGKYQAKLLTQALRLTRSKASMPAREKFLSNCLSRLSPRHPPRRRARKKNPLAKGKPNALYIQAAEAYAKTLRLLGKKDQAARVLAKLSELTGDKK